MHCRHFVGALSLAAACLFGPSLAASDTAPIRHNVVPYALKSGPLTNASAVEAELYSTVIHAGDVPWVRIAFGDVRLAPGSRIELTSLLDGKRQTLTAVTLAQWRNTSAYFNGSAVRLALIAAGPGDNAVEVDRLIVGEWENSIESQCGPTDDRVPSEEPARARLLNVGCSASIYNEQSCFITAGHCLSSPSFVNVVEFNVPPSLANGTIQHPGPEDQYVPTSERQFVDGGVGNDWGLFKVFANSETGLMPFEAQGEALTLGTSLPPDQTTLRIVGYGVDSGTRNQTQQVHTGPLVSVQDSRLNYQIDTEGGNSGSAVSQNSDDTVVGIHTHGGCRFGGGGANSGTAITHPNLQAALATFCEEDPGVTCGEVDRMVAQCNAQTNNRVRVIIRMTDTSNQGETLVVTIDGQPRDVPLTLGGGRFGFTQGNFGSGLHTISLVDPAGCTNIPDVSVNCP